MTVARVYGIDFGTSNSALRIVQDDGRAVWVKDPGTVRGSWSVPSAVLRTPSGEMLVGYAAERAKLRHARGYRSEFKRDVGDPQPILLAGVPFAAHELVGRVLAFLREQADRAVSGEPEHVVLTVPAAWEQGNQRRMVDAAAAAGFDPNRVQLVTEPVAAAAAAFAGAGDTGAVLVYDLGGGTFDCAVAGQGIDGMEVIGAPGGLADVGGRTFDELIVAEIGRRFPAEMYALTSADRNDPDVVWRLLSLRDAAEEAKIQLSVAREYSTFLPALGPSVRLDMTRDQLARLLDPLLEETVAECDKVLSTVGMSWADIDRIVPVGGSARLPMVGALLAQRSGRPVLRVDDPELAVAYGAALLAERARQLPDPAGFVAAPTRPRTRRPPGIAPAAAPLAPAGPPRRIAYAPDGTRMAVAGASGLQMWRLPEAAVLWTVHDDVRDVAFGPPEGGGSRLAVATATGGIGLYRFDGRPGYRWDGGAGAVRAVAYSGSGQHLAAVGRRFWLVNLVTETVSEIRWDRSSLTGVAFSPDGLSIIAGAEDGGVQIKQPGRPPEPLVGHGDAVLRLAFDASGSTVASAGRDGTVLLQHADRRDRPLVLRLDGSVAALGLSPDGAWVAAGSGRGEVVVWARDTGAELGRMRFPAAVADLAVHPDGRELAVAVGAEVHRLRPPSAAPAGNNARAERVPPPHPSDRRQR